MTKSTQTQKTETFAWNEENTQQASDLYLKNVEDLGAVAANERLKQIAETVGAKSAAAVRSKLVSAGVYVKADQPRKIGGASSVRKVHYVRAILASAKASQGEDLAEGALESLEQAKMSDLKIVADMLGLSVTAE